MCAELKVAMYAEAFDEFEGKGVEVLFVFAND